jgi:hypothetical protein
MIHEILQSDVELARGMVNSCHPDAEILAFLASRGVEPAKATQLLDDLRHGRQPNVQLPFVPRPDDQGALDRVGVTRREAPREHHSASRGSRSGKHKRPGISWWLVILILVFLWALGYALFGTGTGGSNELIDRTRHELPPAPGKDALER